MNTSAGRSFESQAWPQDLVCHKSKCRYLTIGYSLKPHLRNANLDALQLVTLDFAKTVQLNKDQSMDDFLRPVHWILSGQYYNQISCVVISPYEANYLLPSIRKYQKVTLHIYAPRSSISHQNLDDLSFCAFPPVPKYWSPPKLSTQINLFAGQLYIHSFEDYLNLCRFLGLSHQPPDGDARVAQDGFINPDHRILVNSVMVCQVSTLQY